MQLYCFRFNQLNWDHDMLLDAISNVPKLIFRHKLRRRQNIMHHR